MQTVTHSVPRVDLKRLAGAKSQRPAHISRSAFLTEPAQQASSEDLPLDMDVDGANTTLTDDMSGAASGVTSDFGQSFEPTSPATNKRAWLAEEDYTLPDATSSAKRAKTSNVTSIASDGSSLPEEKKIPQFAVG